MAGQNHGAMEDWSDGVLEYWSGGVALIVGLEFTCRVKTSAFPSSLPGFLWLTWGGYPGAHGTCRAPCEWNILARSIT